MRSLAVFAVFALVVGACAASEPDSASSSSTFTVDGQPLVNVADLLEDSEALIGPGAHPEARCFLSTFGGQELNPVMRCGPQAVANRTYTGIWQTYELGVRSTQEGAELAIRRDFGRGWELVDGEKLERPDEVAPLPDDSWMTAATGDIFATQWRSVAESFHYCMGEAGLLAFKVEFLFDGRSHFELEQEHEVTAMQLDGYLLLSFSDAPPAPDVADAELDCLNRVAEEFGVPAT